MSRRNIFELLKEKYNVPNEMEKIVTLYNSKLFYYNGDYGRGNYTPEEIFEHKLLKNWKQRGSYLNCREIKDTIGVPRFFTFGTPIEDVLNTLEYYENISYLLVKKLNILDDCEYTVSDDFTILLENMQILLDHLNYEFQIFEKEEKLILVPKNPAATSVAEISDEETAMAILMYNHHTLKGDLEAKRKILYSIAKEYEPLLSKPIDGFKEYFVKATNMLNNLDIRHNNKEGKHKNNLVINLENDELEKWYDELYQLLLFCVLIKDNIERKNNIEEFLKQLKQGA